MTKNLTIAELPDLPAIKQIVGALWGSAETRGAAVLVGAGFSRNAKLASPMSRKPPLWSNFSRIMREALYGNKESTISDPLKLAEEYKAALGPTALDNLIYELVPDSEWRPGIRHSKLVDLPWTDILTTNWDTLLERAAELTEREDTYDVVRAIADIPRTRSPRVVKLHGSMPSNRPFIFTEEDFRTYPKRFAPFVNLVQQVLMENELCLLGFSGDDPNFLQWSGWIRDQLGDSARRIYLVGVLNLSPPERKYLEARKVTPVDLAPTVLEIDAEDQHSAAVDLFLNFLRDSRPKPAWKWLSDLGSMRSQQLIGMSMNESGSDALVPAFRQLISHWRGEREGYPGWLVCPSADRRRIRSEIGNPEHMLRRVWDRLQNPDRDAALYEIAWRLNVAFFSFSDWCRGLLVNTLDDSASTLSRRQRREIAAILLRISREERNHALFERCVAFLQNNGDSDADVFATVAYEKGLKARDQLNYPEIGRLLPTINGDDPAWKLRRAALHYELGEFEKASALVIEGREEVRRRFFRDRKSIWNISRLAWAQFIARASKLNANQSQTDDPPEVFSERFARNKCVPWDELDELDSEINDEFQQKTEAAQREEPGFEAGTYRQSVRWSSSVGWAVHNTLRVMDIVGLPTTVGSVDVMRSRMARAVGLSISNNEGELLNVIRVLGGPSDRLIEQAFSRIEVARIPLPVVQKLIHILWEAIDFGRVRAAEQARVVLQPGLGNFWVERLRVLAEVLSRLVVRLDSEKAVDAFRKAASIVAASDFVYWTLFEPFGNLLQRSLLAVSPQHRKLLVLEILELPLPDERGLKAATADRGPLDEWPEVMARLPIDPAGRRSDEGRFAARVSVLNSKVSNGDRLTRGRAAIRLARLQLVGSLNEQESISFGQALWSRRQSDETLPQDTGVLAHVLFDIPGHDKEEVKRVFRSNVLDKLWPGLQSPETLTEVVGATRRRSNGFRPFQLTTEEALRLFRLILDWQPRPVAIDLDQYNSKMTEILGRALIEAVLPFVDLKSLGEERIEELFNKVEAGTLTFAVIALPDIIALNSSLQNRCIEIIHRAGFSRQRDVVFYALSAVDRWRLLSKEGTIPTVPQRLTHTVIATVAGTQEGWLSSALYVAGKLLEDGLLNESDRRELSFSLDRLRTETAYSSWDTSDPRSINVTHVRAACVRLAESLRKAGIIDEAVTLWINTAKDDPIPEVRYALGEPDS